MINEVNNQIMEPNPYCHQQKSYLLQNTVNNNNNNNNYCFSASANDYNFQPINNNNIEEEKESFRPKTCTENFKKFEISDNNNYNSNFDDDYDENNMEEDTEKEAVEFIQLQHEKIKKLKKELKIKDEIINEYKEKFNKLNLKNKDDEEKIILCKNLRKQIEILSKEKEELKLELYSKDKLIKELKIDLNDLSKKFNKFNSNILSQSEEKNDKVNQLLQLIKEYSSQLKENEEKIKIYETEFLKINQNLTNEMKEKQKLKILYDDKLAEEKKWISQINADIQILCEWMKNYIGIYLDNSVEIQDVPLFTPPINTENVLTFNKFNFNLLRQTISDVRNNIFNKQSKYENIIQQDKKEQIELINKIESQNKNIASLNNDIISLKEEISHKNVEFEEMRKKINDLMT
jgi:chromosome segregation ATPase